MDIAFWCLLPFCIGSGKGYRIQKTNIYYFVLAGHRYLMLTGLGAIMNVQKNSSTNEFK